MREKYESDRVFRQQIVNISQAAYARWDREFIDFDADFAVIGPEGVDNAAFPQFHKFLDYVVILLGKNGTIRSSITASALQ